MNQLEAWIFCVRIGTQIRQQFHICWQNEYVHLKTKIAKDEFYSNEFLRPFRMRVCASVDQQKHNNIGCGILLCWLILNRSLRL